MTSVLAPADVEAALVAFLPAPSGTRLPNPIPAPAFTRVTRTGGEQRNLVQVTTRVLIECFAANETAAFDRAQMAWALLWGAQRSYLAEGVWVTRIELTDPVNFPDPSSTRARYQFIASLTVSLVPLETA